MKVFQEKGCSAYIRSNRNRPQRNQKVKEVLEAGKTPNNVSVDLKMSIVKEVGACWLLYLYDYFLGNPNKGFVQAGITEATTNPTKIREITEDNDPFNELSGCYSD